MDVSEIVFSRWKEFVQEEYKTSRFTKIVAKEVLELLMESFKGKNVDIETVASFERKVVDFLVTEEGRKGGKNKRTGKDYKDWVNNVKVMFKASLGEFYENDLVVNSNQDDFSAYLMQNPIVRSWVEHKFTQLQESLLREVCIHGSPLNLLMQEELFNSGWSQTGENVPEYVKKVIA